VSEIVFMCWRPKVEQFLNKAIRNINQREAARHVCMENSARLQLQQKQKQKPRLRMRSGTR